MRASIVIAAHNEGTHLRRTVESCLATVGTLDYEIIIADDASTDGSVDDLARRTPRARFVRCDERKGASPTKAAGAEAARGETLIFLDGHSNPEPGALERLVDDVEHVRGQAIVTPRVAALCTRLWRNKSSQVGSGYSLTLDTLDCGWMPESRLRGADERGRRFFESPALIGCALAVSRELYDRLRGFDAHMFCWGVEDLDLGLKCWLLGHPILHDPAPVIGHRFRAAFDNYTVSPENVLANQMRMRASISRIRSEITGSNSAD